MFASMGAASHLRGDHREWRTAIAHTVAGGVASARHAQEQWAARDREQNFLSASLLLKVALSILQEVALLESHPLTLILYVRDTDTGKRQRKRSDQPQSDRGETP